MAAVRPRSTALPAAFSPGGPAPITMTSNSSAMSTSFAPDAPRTLLLREPDDQIGHQSGPPRLVRRPQARSGVSVEILVERDRAVPRRVGLELLVRSEHRPLPGPVICEKRDQSARQLRGDLAQRELAARPGGELDLQVLPQVPVVA